MKNRNKRNKRIKGFTMAELLIVVAIIAVLVGVAIPILNTQLEKAREAYDIYTMRQAASVAVDLYYQGVSDESSATAAGLKWWAENNNNEKANAAGVYSPGSGTFLPKSSKDNGLIPYGKGKKKDGGTRYVMGNDNGAYIATEDYTDAVVMVAIYPKASRPHIDVYWKYTNKSKDKAGTYVGGQASQSDPKYSIRIYAD